MMISEGLKRQFPSAAGYLNTASIGLPPQVAVDAMQDAITEWQAGQAQAAQYDNDVAAARSAFAQLVSTPLEQVAIGSQVSALVSLAITALEPGSRVMVPIGEFTSVIFPLLVRDDLNLQVESVPLSRLASSIRSDVDLVAFSAVQSSSGELADLASIKDAANSTGTAILLDATQAAGWLPFDATDYDFVVASTYKWLLSPRGTAFMTVSASMLERTRPLYAGWYAGASPWDSIYGMPLRLAKNARRLDLSPGWLAWVGTAPALALLNDIGIEKIHNHNLGLANALLAELDMPPGDSAILSFESENGFEQGRLSGLSTAYRAGRLRVGFHLYNTEDDVAKVAAALKA